MHLITKTYNGLPIEFTIDNNELYINATKTARYFGREAKHWKYTKFPLEYFKAYSNFLKEYSNTFSTDNILSSEQLIVSIHGGKAVKQGTWIHKKLIAPFTSWLDMDFAIWCEHTVETISNLTYDNKSTNMIKELDTDEDSDAVIGPITGVIPDATDGKIYFHLNSSDTDIESKIYIFDIIFLAFKKFKIFKQFVFYYILN